MYKRRSMDKDKRVKKEEKKSMERFLVASKNKDKIHEIKEILDGFPFEIVGMESIGIQTDIVEDADSC